MTSPWGQPQWAPDHLENASTCYPSRPHPLQRQGACVQGPKMRRQVPSKRVWQEVGRPTNGIWRAAPLHALLPLAHPHTHTPPTPHPHRRLRAMTTPKDEAEGHVAMAEDAEEEEEEEAGSSSSEEVRRPISPVFDPPDQKPQPMPTTPHHRTLPPPPPTPLHRTTRTRMRQPHPCRHHHQRTKCPSSSTTG